MKKFLAILCAMLLTATAAFADEISEAKTVPAGGVVYSPTVETTFNDQISLTYNSTDYIVVYETLTFTATAEMTNPDGGTANLNVDEMTVTSVNPGYLSITVPSLSEAGIYEWTIVQDEGDSAGVSYSPETVHVVVLVEYDNTDHKLVIGQSTFYIAKNEDGNKTTTLTNEFNAHGFTVAKDVQGNMANEADEFEITVSLMAYGPVNNNINFAGTVVTPAEWEETTTSYGTKVWKYSKAMDYSEAGGEKTFTGLPSNAYAKIEETETEMNGYERIVTTIAFDGVVSATEDGEPYDVDGIYFIWGVTQDAEFTVVNARNTTIEAGVTVDSLPYIVLLGAVVLAGVVMIIRRRAHNI